MLHVGAHLPNDAVTPLYSDDELREIDSFLSHAFHRLHSEHKFAVPYDPQAASKAVNDEITRLRKKRRRADKKPVAKDVDELVEAISGPFAKERPHVLNKAIADFKQANTAEPGTTLGHLFVKHLLKKLCGKRAVKSGPTRILITSASLAAVFKELELPVVFAPVCVWALTIIRDVGMPALCRALSEYLASRERRQYPGDSTPYVSDFTTGRNAQLRGVTIAGAAVGNATTTVLTFDAYGRPLIASDLVITLDLNGTAMTVTVSKATGDVSIMRVDSGLKDNGQNEDNGNGQKNGVGNKGS